MIDPKSISEELLYATVRIVGEGPKGTKLGSGFFYRVPAGEKGDAVLLVTNKHVIADCKMISFLMHSNSEGGRPTKGNVKIESEPARGCGA